MAALEIHRTVAFSALGNCFLAAEEPSKAVVAFEEAVQVFEVSRIYAEPLFWLRSYFLTCVPPLYTQGTWQ